MNSSRPTANAAALDPHHSLVDRDLQLMGQTARCSEWRPKMDAAEGAAVHVYHATAFPLRAYLGFLGSLAAPGDGGPRLSPFGLWQRGAWPETAPPDSKQGWEIFATDLIAFLEATQQEPVIAIGHSSGATTTAMAAVRRPELFRALVLIEPATVSEKLAFWLRRLPYRWLSWMEPARSTLRKPVHWNTQEELFADYRAHRSFRRFPDEALRDLTEAALQPKPEGGFKPTFDKDWEVHSYKRPPSILPTLRQLTVPTVAIRGKPSMFLSDEIWQWWQRKDQERGRESVFFELPQYGHLAPLEAPEDCAALVRKGLRELGLAPIEHLAPPPAGTAASLNSPS